MAQASPSPASAFHRFLRSIPGLRSFRECLHETPGTWLLRRPYTDWLGDSALVSQLPASLRMFARYCSAQRGDPVGAELLLRLIIWLRRTAGAASAVRLDVAGRPIFVDLGDPRFLAIPSELTGGLPRLLGTFLRPGDTFVDVGSNHGTFAATAAQIVGADGLVVAIEPQARLANLIRSSLDLYDARSVVHNVACSDRPGSATLYMPHATSGSGGLHPAHSAVSQHRTDTVSLTRLDDLLDPEHLPGRVLAKIDVEGSETRCLLGAQNFLARAQPAILMEINPKALAAAGSSTQALTETLRDSGYHRYLQVEGGLSQELELSSQIARGDIVVLPRSWRG